ncbi:GntR family transcriptional regulator [Tetragenococcus koreensis]|uniref:GntR family transcriptional regulator n=1 Tax=Tetragenococcus koreensis TaxID=290335 RepID=A0AAN4ZPJ9_9ENTE|nr:GntR family transcriptional regulator [Tetragenococcus koreensis]AYW44561.1 GntR family transcriptional regulator [Tetragenococcus koreensis]MCF1584528.1 GntR family transcriptional regulator [Tetragenococcus koreensis]MCF1614077.1 GntR family transcriptional regulator [Tetragenococcus koreensis]MCF1617717.1 GntR family transcriptional regulator [Tetragenococcus koreensis]MCF1619314.1 GntR family transcriptional regulator [Tetragenococcus koreensis]
MDPIVVAIKHNLDLSQNKPLKICVYKALRKTIILGDIPAGKRINEKELSEELNISRTPIRFALQELVKEQLVEHVPRIGIIVKGISMKDAYEIYDIRKALDTLATTKAMTLMNDNDFDELEQLLEQGELYNKTDQVDELLQNFSDFNSFIYKKSQMLRLKAIVTDLQAYLVYFRDIAIRASARRSLALEEHWLIFRGMKTNDVEQITLITHEHLDRSLQFILKEMERREIE